MKLIYLFLASGSQALAAVNYSTGHPWQFPSASAIFFALLYAAECIDNPKGF